MTQKRINQRKCKKLKIKLFFMRLKMTNLLSPPKSFLLACEAAFYRADH